MTSTLHSRARRQTSQSIHSDLSSIAVHKPLVEISERLNIRNHEMDFTLPSRDENCLASFKEKAFNLMNAERTKPISSVFKNFCASTERETMLNRFLLSSLLYFSAFFKKKELLRESQGEYVRGEQYIDKEKNDSIQKELNHYFIMTSQAYFNILSHLCFGPNSVLSMTASEEEGFFHTLIFYCVMFCTSVMGKDVKKDVQQELQNMTGAPSFNSTTHEDEFKEIETYIGVSGATSKLRRAGKLLSTPNLVDVANCKCPLLTSVLSATQIERKTLGQPQNVNVMDEVKLDELNWWELNDLDEVNVKKLLEFSSLEEFHEYHLQTKNGGIQHVAELGQLRNIINEKNYLQPLPPLIITTEYSVRNIRFRDAERDRDEEGNLIGGYSIPPAQPPPHKRVTKTVSFRPLPKSAIHIQPQLSISQQQIPSQQQAVLGQDQQLVKDSQQPSSLNTTTIHAPILKVSEPVQGINIQQQIPTTPTTPSQVPDKRVQRIQTPTHSTLQPIEIPYTQSELTNVSNPQTPAQIQSQQKINLQMIPHNRPLPKYATSAGQ